MSSRIRGSEMPTSSADPVRRGKGGLVVEGLGAGYGGELVVREVGPRGRRGEIATVVGPNGSGKSTLLKGITGVIVVSEGRVLSETKTSPDSAPTSSCEEVWATFPNERHICAADGRGESAGRGYTLRKSEVSASMQRLWRSSRCWGSCARERRDA